MYRLLTSGFIHWDVLHLANNMVTVLISIPMEMENGWYAFLFTYILSTIGGNLFSVLIAWEQIVAAGASTGISGLLSIYITSAIMNREKIKSWVLRVIICIIVTFNVILDSFVVDGSNWTLLNHLGGFISGIPIAVCLLPNDRWERFEMIIVIASLALLAIIFSLFPIIIWGIRSYSFLD